MSNWTLGRPAPDDDLEYHKMIADYAQQILLKEEGDIIKCMADSSLPGLIRLRDCIDKAIEEKRKDLGVL